MASRPWQRLVIETAPRAQAEALSSLVSVELVPERHPQLVNLMIMPASDREAW